MPDVAGNSGSTTGYLVSQPPGSQIPIAPVGGTSAAAPMWAALIACVRVTLSSSFNGNVPVFFFNDFVYANGTTAAFRDIVGGRQFSFDPNQGLVPGAFIPIGNNRITQVDGYNASQGYDLCTGWEIFSFDAHDRAKGRLGLAVAVEQQRVFGVLPRECVEPASAVVEVPEGDPRNRVGPDVKHLEQIGVLPGLPFQKVDWATAGERIRRGDLLAILTPICPPDPSGDYAQVQLRDDHFQF